MLEEEEKKDEFPPLIYCCCKGMNFCSFLCFSHVNDDNADNDYNNGNLNTLGV